MASESSTVTLRMFLAEERPTAVKVASTAAGVAWIEWIPRSLIAYARKEKPAAAGERQPYVFILPEWKVEQANLWKYVTS